MSVNFNALYLDSRAFVFAKREIMLSSLYFYFAHRSVLSPLGLCTVCVQYFWRSEEITEITEIRVTGNCELPRGCWTLNLGPP